MKKHSIHMLLTGLLLTLFVTAGALAEGGAKAIAVTLTVKGKVEIKQGDGGWVALKFGTVLNDGDKIRTAENSFVALVFTDDKSQIKLRPKSEVTITAKRNPDHSLAKRLNMEVGELFADVKKQKGSLEVATPTAVASVKGTVFWVIVNTDGTTTTLTLEGIIQLISNLTGESIEVIAGQFGIVDLDGGLDGGNIVPEDIPQVFDDLELNYIEIDFIDEDGNQKSIIIQYNLGEE